MLLGLKGAFDSADDYPLPKADLADWNGGQPDSREEECVAMAQADRWGWSDVFCTSEEGFVCREPMACSHGKVTYGRPRSRRRKYN